MGNKTLSIQLTPKDIQGLKEKLSNEGWKEEDSSNEYVALRMKNSKGSTAMLYTSGKLVLQGNEDFQGLIETEQEDIFPHLGVDEVGKGDYFGPLVVVACYIDSESYSKAKAIGVGDSKKFSDGKILDMYNLLKNDIHHYVSIVEPKKYNELYPKLKNVSILLAKEHSRVIEMGLKDLQEKNIECKKAVIDQFSSNKNRVTNELGSLGKGIEFVQFHKGESDMAVACASVIARGIFLEEMEKMNTKYYFKFPKGASNVIDQAKEFVSKHGVEELGNVAKISFKTTAKVMQSSF